MTLRGKLIAAQAPLAIALVVIAGVASTMSIAHGRSSTSVVKDGTLILLIAGAAMVSAFIISIVLTTRILRPLSILGQAARRLGEGDMAARARVGARDETADLAREFNTMADRLAKYQASSLGDLLQAQQQAQTAIDALTDPVLSFDSNGSLLNVNRAAESLLRITVETTNALSNADPAVRQTIERQVAGVLGGTAVSAAKGFEDALCIPGPQGDVFLVPRASPARTEQGGVVGCTIVLQDVTRLMRFDELKNNLVATVAQDFRTPLTSLRLAIHLCGERLVGELTEKQADLMLTARQDTERLQEIVDDLVDLSRIQSGKMELHRRVLSVDSVLAEAVRPFKEAASQKNVSLRTEVQLALGDLTADPERIDLVLGNLIGNAVKHTPQDGTVSVRAHRVDGAVRFEVEDTGPGIPAEYRMAIFDRFFRLPGSAETGGTGLGLFISKEIVSAHGGTIGVDGAPGKGATFWFEVPLAPESVLVHL